MYEWRHSGEISVKFHNKLFQRLLNVEAVVSELWGALRDALGKRAERTVKARMNEGRKEGSGTASISGH